VSDISKSFVLISDGQSWSGEVAKSLALAQGANIPLSVIGVGTTAGGIIPDPKREANQPVVRSILNRAELTKIATAGGGRYYELDRETDREIANQIIDQTRRRAGITGIQEGTRELYWNFLFAAGVFLSLGVLFLRDRVALALQLAAAAAVFIFITAVF
jgi:Ca-activated chloride channel family protein